MRNTKFKIVISADLDRKPGNGMRRNTRVETYNVSFLGWVTASLVFIILLFIMYILHACIFFLYSKSLYQMTMFLLQMIVNRGKRFALVMIPLPWSPWPLRCCVLFHRWGSSEMLQNYQLLLLTFAGNIKAHPKRGKKITRLDWALGRLPSSDYLTGYWPPYGWASFG